jgi:hypothetical protein
MITNCLTFEQLQAYTSTTINKVEKSLLYTHISNCELCACAVNGFATIPFASDELVAIHRKIDAKTNATSANPLTFSRVIIMMASFIAIAFVYKLADNNKKQIATPIELSNSTILIPIKNEKKTASSEEILSVTKTYKKIVSKIQYQKFERTISPTEQLDIIEPISIHSLMKEADNSDFEIKVPENDLNSLYIYDLKISDYNNLYFSFQKKDDNSFFENHTSVSRENKKSPVDENEEKEQIPSDKILKKGLLSFREQDFHASLFNFDVLLDRNAKDVNAQFYSALAYYNLNNMSQAIDRLNKVLANNNIAFYSEAQWYLVLASLKMGETESAKIQLSKIISEKGFYSKNAKQKLNSLN